MKWPDNNLNLDLMMHWIIEMSQEIKAVLTDVGVFMISVSIQDYAYLILDVQASIRSRIVGPTLMA